MNTHDILQHQTDLSQGHRGCARTLLISAIYNFGMAFMLPKSIGCSHDQLLQGLLKTNPEEIKQNENRLFSVNMLNSFSVTLIILQDCGWVQVI